MGLESDVAEATIQRILECYEDVYREGSRVENGVGRYLVGLRDIIGASFVSTLLMEPSGTRLRLDIGDATSPHALRLDWLQAQFSFADSCRLYSLSGAQLNEFSRVTHEDLNCSLLLLATFRLDTVPACILFGFDRATPDAYLERVCAVGAREGFHLYRARDLVVTLDSLKQLGELPIQSHDKGQILWSMLSLLKLHFSANGASLLEVLESDGERISFSKTLMHRGRRETERFFESFGFAHYCVMHCQALLIERIVNDGADWYGIGYAFDIDAVTPGVGAPVRIKAYVTPKTIEAECSLLYFPLTTKGDVNAVLKIANFRDENAYNIRHLKQLKTLSHPIASFLADVTTISSLREQLARESVNQKMVEFADRLFMYREIALGMFHQATNHAARADSELVVIDSLLDAKRNPEIHRRFVQTRSAIRDAKELIRKAQQRGRTLEPISEDCKIVEDIVRPALKYIEHEHPEVNLRHSLREEDYIVKVDPAYLREGLYNVLNNAVWAVKHSHRGGKREIFVAVRVADDDDKLLRIRVEDAGVGIERQFVSELFKPFATTKPEGTGLGLYFARQLIEHFGGHIDLERSMPGKGSVFVISLPIVRRAT